ncbi:MAG: hypothetical protein CVU47_13070 [Chloroflexi bacterium HGW-Chloroflexi-9]|nr:MAG: hypothetical protein CVU47_13070 [Chloroflexi bacterium HGW-Chloroflexi-9]
MSWLVPAEVIALREFVDDALHRTAFVDDEQRRVPANARTEDALMTLRDVLAGAVTPVSTRWTRKGCRTRSAPNGHRGRRRSDR